MNLDSPALGFVNIQPRPGAAQDLRFATVTVRQLLQHTGGWDQEKSGDPMNGEVAVANALGVPPPATCSQAIQFMLGRPLDFDPGSQAVYSNFGYCLLGRVIEEASGMSYEDYVRKSVMAPAGITRMQLGHTLRADRYPGEVQYYDYPGAPLVRSVFPDVKNLVPFPEGGFWEEGRARDANGGWIGSAVDLLKFTTMLGGRRPPPLLQPATLAEMLAAPAPPVVVGSGGYFGLGWQVRPANRDFLYWKNGGFRGTVAYLARMPTGWEWAAVFNSASRNMSGFENALTRAAYPTVNALSAPPDIDHFQDFP